MTASIRVQGLGWRPFGRSARVLHDLDLTVEEGERVGIVGPSGAGKSTLLHALAGALGEGIGGDLEGLVETSGPVGLVLQDPSAATVADRIGRDVAFGPENMGLARAEIWSRVRDCLDRVGLTQGLDRPTAALSGGERQRLALAGILAMEPAVMLLDEPTSMLDPMHADQVRRAVLDTLADRRTSLVVADHHIGDWLEHLDRVLLMAADGTVHEVGDPSRLVSDHGATLTEAGVWLPGIAAPEPWTVPAELVAAEVPGPELSTLGLGVDLVSRRVRGTTRTVALDGVDLTVRRGDLTAITGPSGAGKSTLLAVLAGLVSPTRGSVSGPSPSLDQLGSVDLARIGGWVPQSAEHGFVTSRVRDEVAFTAGRVGREVDVDQVLDLLRLGQLGEANPYRLSGGEQRRLALAAALAHRPGLVSADEPTVGQDRHTWAAVAGWLRSASRHDATVSVATHDRFLIELADAQITLRGEP